MQSWVQQGPDLAKMTLFGLAFLEHGLDVRNKRQQVRLTHIHARLRQQRRGLPSVVGLVVEKVHHHATQILRFSLAPGVGVSQGLRQIVYRQNRSPSLYRCI